MTKCFKVKSIRMDIHGDTFAKVDGIHVEVIINTDQFDILHKGDLVSCEYNYNIKRYVVEKVFKNSNSIASRYILSENDE